jgi:hypothetical protein
MRRKQAISEEVRIRVDGFVGEAGGAGLGDGRREWRFDGTKHRITLSGLGAVEASLVAEFRSVGDDLTKRMLVASMWPGPLGVIYVWSEWRRDRATELAQHCGEVRAAAVVGDLFTAARGADAEGVARGVARYYAVLDESRRDAAVAAMAWNYILA